MRLVLLLLVIVSFTVTPGTARADDMKLPRVGLIRPGSVATDLSREWFLRGMRDLGYVEGRNVAFEFRYYGDDVSASTSSIAELEQLKVKVIVTTGTPVIRAVQKLVAGTPIVMAPAADPVGTGLIASLARPAGNTTGLALLSTELTAKRLELMREILPQARRIAVLKHSDNPSHTLMIQGLEAAKQSTGLAFEIFEARRADDLGTAFAAMTAWRPDAIIVLDDPTFVANRAALVTAAGHRVPLVCGFREMTGAGCLFSYAVSLQETWYRAATYVDKILKGAKPADLPVEQPTKFELVVNLKTAEALGLTIPASILLRADEVIE